MAREWPPVLPYRPQMDAYRREEVDKRVVFEPESGEPKRRPRTSRRAFLHEMVIVVQDDQVAALDEFWRQVGQGTLPFVFPEDPLTGEADVEVAFESRIGWTPSGEVNQDGRPTWRASFVLRRSV